MFKKFPRLSLVKISSFLKAGLPVKGVCQRSERLRGPRELADVKSARGKLTEWTMEYVEAEQETIKHIKAALSWSLGEKRS